MRLAQLPVRSIPEDKRLRRQLLDKPLHRPRHFPPAARQVTDVRPHFRHVRLLVAGLFQPLRATASGSKPDSVPGLIFFPLSSSHNAYKGRDRHQIGGPSDPNYVLLHFVGKEATFWINGEFSHSYI